MNYQELNDLNNHTEYQNRRDQRTAIVIAGVVVALVAIIALLP